MLKKFLNLSALCRVIANRPSPMPLHRTYGNKFLADPDPEDYANEVPVQPDEQTNQVIVYTYPIPPRPSYIRLIQEANQLEKRRNEAKCGEQSPSPKEIESKHNAKDANSEEKNEDCDIKQANDEVKMQSKIPALGKKAERRRSWPMVNELNEAVAEDQKMDSEASSTSVKYIVPKFQQLKFEGIVNYRKPKTDHGIKYEKVSAAVQMHRRGKKS